MASKRPRRRGSSSQPPQEQPPPPQPQPPPPPPQPQPQDIHISFLNSPNLSTYFDKLSTYDIQQDRYVNFRDLQNYNTDDYFEQTGLQNLLHFDNLNPCFPYLVKLFYTNMDTTVPPQPTAITSNVLNKHISFQIPTLGRILGVPYIGSSLKAIKMNNEEILGRMLYSGTSPQAGINSNDLRPEARIISRILSWSIIPKGGSYSYVSVKLLQATYAILGDIKVNWARVIYDNITKPSSKVLHHGNFLTTIFKAFDVNVLQEGLEVLPLKPYFDTNALSRMHLPYDPNDSGNEEEMQVDQEEEEEDEEEEEEEAPQAPQFPGYDELLHRVDNLTLAQERMVASHYVMLNEVSTIRRDQRELRAYQREIRDTQREIREGHREMMLRFNQQFPPPQE